MGGDPVNEEETGPGEGTWSGVSLLEAEVGTPEGWLGARAFQRQSRPPGQPGGEELAAWPLGSLEIGPSLAGATVMSQCSWQLPVLNPGLP